MSSSSSSNISIRVIKEAKALDEYLSTHDYVVIKFTANWCGPCKKMSPEIKKLANKYPDVHFIEIDVDQIEPEVMTKYDVDAIPVILSLISADNVKDRVKDRVVGFHIEKLKKLVESLDTCRRKNSK